MTTAPSGEDPTAIELQNLPNHITLRPDFDEVALWEEVTGSAQQREETTHRME